MIFTITLGALAGSLGLNAIFAVLHIKNANTKAKITTAINDAEAEAATLAKEAWTEVVKLVAAVRAHL